jgi:hypothetical protein
MEFVELGAQEKIAKEFGKFLNHADFISCLEIHKRFCIQR